MERCARAVGQMRHQSTMAELSTPPDRKAPSGTSDIICRSTASSSRASNASTAASGRHLAARGGGRDLGARPVETFARFGSAQEISTISPGCTRLSPSVDREVLADIAVAHQLHDGARSIPPSKDGCRRRAASSEPNRKRRVSLRPASRNRAAFPPSGRGSGSEHGSAVPDGDGEHAHRAGDRRPRCPRRRSPPPASRCPNARARPALCRSFQLGAQVEMVVDLAIVADHVAPRGRRHRLMPRGAEIEDGEPAMAKGDARLRDRPRRRGNPGRAGGWHPPWRRPGPSARFGRVVRVGSETR
jgi:hypothetical protein